MNTTLLNNFSVIDLTHDLAEEIPVWSDGIFSFKHEMIENYDYKGYRCFKFAQSEGVGVHMDAPAHFAEQRGFS